MIKFRIIFQSSKRNTRQAGAQGRARIACLEFRREYGLSFRFLILGPYKTNIAADLAFKRHIDCRDRGPFFDRPFADMDDDVP